MFLLLWLVWERLCCRFLFLVCVLGRLKVVLNRCMLWWCSVFSDFVVLLWVILVLIV